MHETAEEAMAETEQMLNVYADFCEEALAIPVIKGRKTDKEKFAGAEATYTIEAMMHDGKALQSGTSHYFGDGFARAFDIQFTGPGQHACSIPIQTSWGMSTRIIGGIIMTHGDDNGLVLPPAVAPVQVIILPIAQHKPGVLDKADELRRAALKTAGPRQDGRQRQFPGWKFAEYEMKGVPLRLEIGPKDIEKGQCVLVAPGQTGRSTSVSLDELESRGARAAAKRCTTGCTSRRWQTAAKARPMPAGALSPGHRPGAGGKAAPGLIEGDVVRRRGVRGLRLKEEAGVGSAAACPWSRSHLGDTCVCCGKPAKHMVVWGKAYKFKLNFV